MYATNVEVDQRVNKDELMRRIDDGIGLLVGCDLGREGWGVWTQAHNKQREEGGQHVQWANMKDGTTD